MWQMDVVKSTMANTKKQKFYAVFFPLLCLLLLFLWNSKQNKWNDSKRQHDSSIFFIKVHFQVKLNNNEKWQSTLKMPNMLWVSECLCVSVQVFFLSFAVFCALAIACNGSWDVAHSHATMRLNYYDFVLNLNAIHWPPSKY